MSTFLGQPVGAKQDAILTVTGSTTLVNSGLSIPIAANQSIQGYARVPISVAGAASGAKFQLVVPAGGTIYQVEYIIVNGSTQAVAIADNLVASAAFSNALANIADHYMFMTFNIANGVTAGSVTLQFAQLVSDAAAANLLKGATMCAVKY
jgi:hypothetical protein